MADFLTEIFAKFTETVSHDLEFYNLLFKTNNRSYFIVKIVDIVLNVNIVRSVKIAITAKVVQIYSLLIIVKAVKTVKIAMIANGVLNAVIVIDVIIV